MWFLVSRRCASGLSFADKRGQEAMCSVAHAAQMGHDGCCLVGKALERAFIRDFEISSPVARSVRFRPVLALSGVRHQRHGEFDHRISGPFHDLAGNLDQLVFSPLFHLEQ